MNKREALRFAAGELEEIAAGLVEEYRSKTVARAREWNKRDLRRAVEALEELRFRMDRIATGARRPAKAKTPDPNQVPLFE